MMAVFTYQARDSRGELSTGTLNAESTAEASRQLRMEGKYVIQITAGAHSIREDEFTEIRTAEAARRVSRTEVIDFCHQLSVMLETGVPLSGALEAFNSYGRTTNFRLITEEVSEDVQSGASLSEALERWPKVFPNLMVTLIKASEASGTMGLMLSRVSKYLNKEHKTAKQIKGALTYPCVMMTLAFGITVFLMTFVLPRFAKIYSSRSAALPKPTQIMLAISNTWAAHWPWILLGMGLAAVGVVFLNRTVAGRRAFDWVRLHIPVVGGMYSKLYLTRFSRTMATLIASGVDLLEAIKITRGVTTNVYYEELWENVIQGIEEGRQLSDVMGESPLIEPGVVRMIGAGEQSGRLGPVMERIGEVAEEDLDDAVAKVTQYIEPAMIVVMGAVIGFVAISMLLPIFTIASAVT